MRLSAENQISGVVSRISEGAVNALVQVSSSDSGLEVSSYVTMEALEDLGLHNKSEVRAAFSDTDVMISLADGPAGTNSFPGDISAISIGAVNARVRLVVSGGQVITASLPIAGVQELGLQVGGRATALVKPTDVFLTIEGEPSQFVETTYELDHGGAIAMTLNAKHQASYSIYKLFNTDAYPLLVDSGKIHGRQVHRIESGYGFHILVKFIHDIGDNPSCAFNLFTDFANHNGSGARWESNNVGIRPSASPICLMKWYVTKGFSEKLFAVLESAFYNKILDLLRSNLVEEAAEKMVEALLMIELPTAYAIAMALKSLSDIFGLIQMAQFDQIVKDNIYTDYLMTVYDYGDGATPRLTSNLTIEAWDGGLMLGEPGYAGAFTDNSTFTANTIYH